MNRWKIGLNLKQVDLNTWESPLPPALRYAAEWQLGTIFIAVVVFAARGGGLSSLVLLAVAILFNRLVKYRGQDRASWWMTVTAGIAMGLLILVGAFVAPT